MGEWGELEDCFGYPDTLHEVQAVAGAQALLRQWGGTDLLLYDPYLMGHVANVLTCRPPGADLLAGIRPDVRLARYLDLCEAKSAGDHDRACVKASRSYAEHLDRMLEFAQRVPAR